MCVCVCDKKMEKPIWVTQIYVYAYKQKNKTRKKSVNELLKWALEMPAQEMKYFDWITFCISIYVTVRSYGEALIYAR